MMLGNQAAMGAGDSVGPYQRHEEGEAAVFAGEVADGFEEGLGGFGDGGIHKRFL